EQHALELNIEHARNRMRPHDVGLGLLAREKEARRQRVRQHRHQHDAGGDEKDLGPQTGSYLAAFAHWNSVTTSAVSSSVDFTVMPSCLARARLMTGLPFTVGTTGRVEGALPSTRMARASLPAAMPCSCSDTVTEASTPKWMRSIQKLMSGSL